MERDGSSIALESTATSYCVYELLMFTPMNDPSLPQDLTMAFASEICHLYKYFDLHPLMQPLLATSDFLEAGN